MRSLLFAVILLIAVSAAAQKAPFVDPVTDVPVISADLGQCTADFKVVDVNMKPIYSARIATEIKYGFAGVRRTTLEIFTNVDGKARFERLPNHSKRPINFDVSVGERRTGVFVDVDEKCHSEFQAVIPNTKNAAKPEAENPEESKK